MASLATACRISARLLNGRAVTRSFSTSSQYLVAQNFVMPALSPTMTEGNIASWKVKEGASFSAGDVLLEIETDKATMDVEAQEDGIMMKIMSQDGAKAVQVGTRIAVVAEAGDDISALELPPDENHLQSAAGASSSEPVASQQSNSAPSTVGASSSSSSQGRESASTGTYNHQYPLMPSVGQLIKRNGISKEEVSRIKGTGPYGRLLKGDVLAYLGAIDTARPETISAHFHKLSHLDLTNIKVAARVAAPSAPKQEPVPQKAEPKEVKVQVSLVLDPVMELQHNLRKKIGVSLDVREFIERAARAANQNLGPSSRPPTADELFDQILGLDKAKIATRGTQGNYRPIVSAVTPPMPRSAPKLDIIDILAGPKTGSRQTLNDRLVPGAYGANSILSLVVPREDQKRAERFLEHCKTILENFPQQLVEL